MNNLILMLKFKTPKYDERLDAVIDAQIVRCKKVKIFIDEPQHVRITYEDSTFEETPLGDLREISVD